MFKKIIFSILLTGFFVIAAFNINAATLMVTSNADSGPGTLRQLIADADSGDVITFAPSITNITLTSGEININRWVNFAITIDGGDGVTISGNNNSRIFYITGGAIYSIYSTFLYLNNLTLENGIADRGGAIRGEYNGRLFATNCIFRYNEASTTTSVVGGSGGAIYVAVADAYVTNCTFYQNKAFGNGGAVHSANTSTIVATNSTFYQNESISVSTSDNTGNGGAINFGCGNETLFLYHCTFVENKATNSGGALYSNTCKYYIYGSEDPRDPPTDSVFVSGRFYSFNCIYVSNEENGVNNETTQITGELIADDNLIENTSTITAATLYDTNTFTGKYILPLTSVKTANILNSSNIVAYQYGSYWGADVPGILSKVAKDQKGETRVTSGFVTYGSVEPPPPAPVYDLIIITKEGNNIIVVDTLKSDSNTTATITAKLDDCHTFINWTDANDNVISTEVSFDIYMIKDTTLNANFELNRFYLTLEAEENGSVNPAGTIEKDCGEEFLITAVPDDGYKFVSWKNNAGSVVSTEISMYVTIISDTTLIATFEERPDEFIVKTIASTEAGGVVYGGGVYSPNANVTLTAIVYDCYTFINWTDDAGNEISKESSFEITVTSDTTLTANFKIKLFNITLKSEENGSVVSLPDVSRECGSVVNIEAIPDDGYKFYSWKDNDGKVISTNNPYDVKMLSDTLLIATFIEEDVVLYELTLYHLIGTTAPPIKSTHPANTTITITAPVVDCYTFISWKSYNEIISEEPSFDLILISDTMFIAFYEKQQFDLELIVAGGGSVQGAGKYDCGTTRTIKAIPDDGANFVNWTDDAGNEISKEMSLEVVLTSDTTLTANFSSGILEYDNYDISIVPNPSDGDFNIVFDNTEEQMISVELLDIAGGFIQNIFEGMAPAERLIYSVNNRRLASGTYFVKFEIKGNVVIRKVIMK